ncbi:MAG: M42 family metallopeptidase [Lachnospiraceae bacterium]|nr:M42 family metallopeptidase [Lachnospiraceae bacterium]
MTDKKWNAYVAYAVEQLKEIEAIPSPTGYTREAAEYVCNQFMSLGYEAHITNKGGVIVTLNQAEQSADEVINNGLLLEAHVDTLGGMVCEIKDNGRLRLSPLGGLNPNNAETENVTIITKFDGEYEGTFQLDNASIHVNGEYNDIKRAWDKMEVVIDEDVNSKEDTKKLGISVGDIVAFDPRTRVTESGYIKSRFLDDKLSVAILLAYAKYLKDENVTLERSLYAHITVYEEVGHGGCSSVPEDVVEAISVDMGCAGGEMTCTEKQVSICAKDSGGPYSYDVVTGLIEAAREAKADYAVDVYPHYGSDVEATLGAGYDLRHGLIGAGVYASHGYERSHIDGVKNVLKLLIAYIK